MNQRKLSDRIGAFATVPMSFVNDRRLSSDAFRVFVFLRSCTNSLSGAETVWPSYETIIETCCLGHRRKLAAALKELETTGWIERKRRFGTSTVYTLTIPDEARQDEKTTSSVVPTGGTIATASVVPTGGTIVVPPVGTIVVPTGGTLTRRIEPDEKNQIAGGSAAAPPPSPSKSKRKLAGFTVAFTEHDDPRVAAYLGTLRPQITESNATLIAQRVASGDPAWGETLTEWALRGWSPTNFSGLFERYETLRNRNRVRASVAKPNEEALEPGVRLVAGELTI